MKKRSSFWPGLIGISIGLLQITACDKKDTIKTISNTTFPDLLPHGFEIKDTRNPSQVDSNFTFSADSSLYSVADLINNSEMDFTYSNGQRQNNSSYSYLYDGNSKTLLSIALQPGQYGRDSLLLYPNGCIRLYKKAYAVSQQGVAEYTTYTYTYSSFAGNTGTPSTPPVGQVFSTNLPYGPVGNPTAIVGKSELHDDAGNVNLIFTDSIQLVGTDPLAVGPYMLGVICGDAKVHFINLRLFCDVPITASDGISQINRYTWSNLRIPGQLPVITTSTDNFGYQRDAQMRPTSIIKNGTPVYTIIYHDR